MTGFSRRSLNNRQRRGRDEPATRLSTRTRDRPRSTLRTRVVGSGRYALGRPTTYAATSLICCSVELDLERGHRALPVRDPPTTRSYDGFDSSRFGRRCRRSPLRACGSRRTPRTRTPPRRQPGRPPPRLRPPRSSRSPPARSWSPLARRRAVRLGRLGAVRLPSSSREEDDARHRAGEEHDRDEHEEARAGCPGSPVAAREVEGEEREDDQQAREDAEPDLLGGDREQHGPEPTRATRSRGAIVRPWSFSCCQYSSARSLCRTRRRRVRSCGSGWRSLMPWSKPTSGRTDESAKATPSNVLWSSLRTITSPAHRSRRRGRRHAACEPGSRSPRPSAETVATSAIGFAASDCGGATRALRAPGRGDRCERGRGPGRLGDRPARARAARARGRTIAYEKGARYVDVDYADQHVRRARIELAEEDSLGWTPPWTLAKVDHLAEEHGALIQIVGDPEPELLADLDGARVGKTRMRELAERYVKAINQRLINWVILAYPNEGWAESIFGEPDVERALRRRRDAARRADPVEAALPHRQARRPGRAAERARFDHLRFRGRAPISPWADSRRHWCTALEETVEGRRHVVNMPTEEVFTTPDRRRTEGVVRSTPLARLGEHRPRPRAALRRWARRRSQGAFRRRADPRAAAPGRRPACSARSRSSTATPASAARASSSWNTLFDENASATSPTARILDAIADGADKSEAELEELRLQHLFDPHRLHDRRARRGSRRSRRRRHGRPDPAENAWQLT